LKILVVDDDFRNIIAMTALLERGHAFVTVVESGADAIAALERMPDIDIVLMDIVMPEMDGYATIRAIRAIDRFKSLPIIAVTGKATAGERQRCIDAGANDYAPKPVNTAELLAALRPWLPKTGTHPLPVSVWPDREHADAQFPPDAPEAADGDQASDRGRSNGREPSAVDGVKFLVVDDDFRNIFAMTALLERGNAKVTVAENGAEAIDILERMPDVDIVLMDIMMPVMDGYATIRAIRLMEQFKSLPIIAVTGKATAGERQRCLDAGANEYVPKPVDSRDLLAALRPWLPTAAHPTA
jgi:CheY-like chemotaxis protein